MNLESIFDILEDEKKCSDALKFAPLARRMRPETLDDIVGQGDVLGPGTWLRRTIEADALSSIILYGPAGTGKTSLANVIANKTKANFEEVSAVSGSVAEVRKVIENARMRLQSSGTKTILFIDEIHRFSRSQQDCLLHAVEDRTIVLIGATTENPYFEVNSALLSRTRVVLIKHLTDNDISDLIDRALHSEVGLNDKFTIEEDARLEILRTCAGDARHALNCLEQASQMCNFDSRTSITLKDINDVSPERAISYDKNKDMHYDVISAFIKSMRGSDPDATLYWLARMLVGGEDPKYIARRIMISASEDIGNADPRAILVASAAFKACEVIGMPECAINLAQAATYNALAPKSNASCNGIFAAMDEVREGPERAVPNYLRDRHRPGSKDYGEYKYPHDFENGWVEQGYLPEGTHAGDFFKPSDRGWEAKMQKRLNDIKHSQ